MPKGANSADFVVWEHKRSPVRFMQSGIICEDSRIERRTHFWIPETKEETADLAKLLEKRNKAIIMETEARIERSQQLDTIEHRQLQEINANIQLHNERVLGEDGGKHGKGLKRKRDAKQIFKPDLLTRGNGDN